VRIYFAVLVPTAFLLHLGWEYLQCRPFFSHGSVPPTAASMLSAALGDLLLTAIAYLGVVAATREWGWPIRPWTRSVTVSLLILAVALSVAVESYGLATGRWAYTDIAPKLPLTNLSLVPVFQLVLLFPFSFALARWVSLRL